MKRQALAGDLTQDAILRGQLTLLQPRHGYRFSVDSLLLQHFVGVPPFGRIVDLGSGVGVIGLALARRDPRAQVILVELVPRVAELAVRNIEANQLGERARVAMVDVGDAAAMRRALPGASCDWAVSSPPFFSLARGPTVPHAEEAVARHDLRLTLEALCREMRRLLKPGGRAAVVYPADRLPELLAALLLEKLCPRRLRLVHPRPAAPAQRVLIEAIKGGRSTMTIAPPLFVRDASGYTDEVRRALGET